MMNKPFLFLSVLLSLIMFGCNLEEKNYNQETNAMKDSLFIAFPTAGRVSVEVKQDFGTEINITLGDATLFNATKEAQLAVANRIGGMVPAIFNHNNQPDKGTLIIVKQENTINTDNDPQIKYDLHLPK